MRRIRALVLAVVLASGPVGTAAAAAQESAAFDVGEEQIERVAGFLAAQRRERDLPGLAAAVVHDGEVILRLTLGDADESGRPVLPDTPFMLASVSKSFTALAVIQLVDGGAVALDDPITTHIPDFELADPDVADALTVRDLIYHRSGLDRSVGADPIDGDDGASLEANVARLEDVSPDRPGVYRYSNINYDVLALLVERVSGMSFAAYMRERVFQPLGMEDSYVDPARAEAGGLAQGYYHWLGLGYRPFDPPFPDGVNGSAGLFASVEDLTHVLLAHLAEGRYRRERVVSREGALRLREWVPFDGRTDAGYAMGWRRIFISSPRIAERTGLPGVELFSHDGNWTAYRSFIWMVPELDLGGALLVNGSDVTAESLLDQVNFGMQRILLEDLPPGDIAPREEFLMRWGKHLMVALLLAQVAAGAYAAAAVVRRFRDDRITTAGWVSSAAAAALGSLALFLIVRVIPATAEAPVGTVMATAPDYRILIIATAGAAVLGGVLFVGLLASMVADRRRA